MIAADSICRFLGRLAGIGILAGCSLFAVSCATNYGGDFFPNKKSNVTLRQFLSVSTGTTGGAATGATGGTAVQGSPTALNGGATGPAGGNPTVFSYQFDPFPNGAELLLNRRTGTSVADAASDNRSTVVNIEVTFRGHDVNNNPVIMQSFLPASGEPDLTQLGTGTGGAASTVTAGQQVSVLRPLSSTVTAATGNAALASVIEFFPPVAAQFTITNGISVTIDQLTLRYFEPDGSLASVSAFNTFTRFLLEANPLATGFGSGTGGTGGAAATATR